MLSPEANKVFLISEPPKTLKIKVNRSKRRADVNCAMAYYRLSA